MAQTPGCCYDLDMSDASVRANVLAIAGGMRCILIKGVGYVFVSKNLEISQDCALAVAGYLAEIGPVPKEFI